MRWLGMLTLLALAACASGGNDYADWVGRDDDALISHWGTPVDAAQNDNGGRNLTFFGLNSSEDLMPFQDLPERRNVFGRTRAGGSSTIDTSQSGKLNGLKAASMDCYVVFATNSAGTVESFETQGSGCN